MSSTDFGSISQCSCTCSTILLVRILFYLTKAKPTSNMKTIRDMRNSVVKCHSLSSCWKKKIIKEKTSSKRISDDLIISDLKITSRFQNKNTNLQQKKNKIPNRIFQFSWLCKNLNIYMTMHYNKIVKLVWFRVVNKNNKLFKQNHKFHSEQSRHRNTIYLLLWVWKLLMKNAFLWSLMSFIWLGSWTMISPKMVDKTHQSRHDWIYLARADLDHRFQKHTISS